MTVEDIESKIKTVKGKITNHTKLYIGYLNMYKCSMTDKHTLQYCENQIQEEIKNLLFFKTEYDKLIKEKEEIDNANNVSNNKIEKKLSKSDNYKNNMVAFDFLQNKSSLTTEKIAYRMKKIHNKLEVENKFKIDSEKVMEVMNTNKIPKNSNQYIEAKVKVKENEYKILCLNNALKKYKSLYVGPSIDYTNDEKTSSESKNMTNNEQNGRIQIKIVSASKLNTLSADMDLRVVISVNGQQFANTTSSKYGRWNESFDVPCDKDAEIEIMVKESRTSVVGLVWFKPSEFKEAETLKKKTMNANSEDITLYTLNLEPAGEIQLNMKQVFEKKQNEYQSDIQRRKAAHKIMLNKLGHKLVSNDSINIFYKCAVCDGFIFYGGLQCVECKYICHNKCARMIIAKCITKSTSDNNNEDKDGVNLLISKYNIPHKFKTSTNLTNGWCCHCGLMLPIGKNQINKCTECGKCCHHECAVFIPNLCGMSNEYAKKFMDILPRRPNPISKPAKSKNVNISLNDFHFVTVLGRGSFGKVMLAEEKKTKKYYAIKMIKKQYLVEKDDLNSMMTEKSVFITVSSENHPFLVNLHSCFSITSRIYFVMDYAQGGDLIYHIRQSNFNTKRAKFYLCEVLLALEFLHKKNIIYRDLKLDNILLTDEGHIKIADYGLCKLDMDVSTTTNTFCGTPEFMAPEILKGYEYTRSVDWWTFGILTYEMLTRRAPFKGKDDVELFRNIIENQPFYPQYIGNDAIQLISLLLNKNPKKR